MDFEKASGAGNRTSKRRREIMAQQLQKECFICHQQVYLSKPSPESKWVKTNLDGSEHIDPARPAAQKQTTFTTSPAQSPQMNEAIAKAHEENIKASADLTQAVNSLSSNISTLIDLIGKYMERMP